MTGMCTTADQWRCPHALCLKATVYDGPTAASVWRHSAHTPIPIRVKCASFISERTFRISGSRHGVSKLSNQPALNAVVNLNVTEVNLPFKKPAHIDPYNSRGSQLAQLTGH